MIQRFTLTGIIGAVGPSAAALPLLSISLNSSSSISPFPVVSKLRTSARTLQ
jgi:hypothetical protein